MTDLLPIPPMETATDPIGSPADLRERWRALMGPLGFGERLLWIGFVGPDRRMHKALTQMPIGRLPDRSVIEELLAGLVTVVQESAPGSTLAVLLTRPGSDGISAEDRRWSKVLTDAARTSGAPLEPLFRANDRELRPI
ncbi:conserved hypothetical protein [uncultured Mycobacterium sp.]|uniref:Uncharacterized protein n=1 Tax=uncultured Mycobacterium sp. TaxID=171292 RepID=A0A1Y5PII8_9MYCO|nr:conserved hypothetical protein [uncultured Mycobacterium sp.]